MRDGEPLSWRHYVYGLTRLGRFRARDSLRLATATGRVYMKEQDGKAWDREQANAAGW